MKIAYDHQIFSFQRYGGVSRYIYELATHLSSYENCEVKILGFANVNNYLKECSSELVVSWPLPQIPYTSRILQTFNNEVSKFWLAANPQDILHETYYYASAKKNILKKTKVVLTVHDMITEKFPDWLPNSERLSRLKFQAIKQADKIICVSESTKQDLLNFLNINEDRLSVVYEGCSLVSLQSPLFLSQPLIPHPYILYVGQRKFYKNFFRLVEAYAKPPLKNDFFLVCFGGGYFDDQEKKLIENLSLPKERIIQISGDDQTLANLYTHASAFVYPSLYEGFGLPPLEAMSCGCPVVCSNTSSIPEVVGDAGEFFDPYDSESMAHALEKVLYSTEKSATLVNLGKQRVQGFTWNSCAHKTSSVYLSLL